MSVVIRSRFSGKAATVADDRLEGYRPLFLIAMDWSVLEELVRDFGPNAPDRTCHRSLPTGVRGGASGSRWQTAA